jgi:pyridoxal phosphate enzyme (YggS family)
MTASVTAIIERNLRDVRSRIAAACVRSRREPDRVRLIAVTKTAQLDWIRALIELGQLDLGENRPQQLAQRAAELPEPVRWHMIGHLQRNKVELIWPHVPWIHSVDSLRLLRSAAGIAAKFATCPRLLLEVNVSGEASKGGFDPEELLAAWQEIQATSLPIVGLMTMAPLVDSPETVRPVFRGLRELRDRLVERSAGAFALPELSMGMSGDFEVAVEEGATMVRVGSKLFEGLEGNAD